MKTYKVTVNKDGLGEVENPYMERTSQYWEFHHANKLPVYSQQGIQIFEGEFLCEKVWQGLYGTKWIDRFCEPDIIDSNSRQIYRVIDVKEEEKTPDLYEEFKYMILTKRDKEMVDYYRQKTIDEVVGIIKECKSLSTSKDQHYGFDAILAKIKELK